MRRTPARPHPLTVTHVLRLVLLGALGLVAPDAARAQARPDRPAPSQHLASDRDLSAWDVALTVDVLGPLSARYGARLEVAPARWASVALGMDWRPPHGDDAVDLTASAQLWPLADGLEGPYIGSGVVLARRAAGLGWAAQGEVGWQWVWSGVVLAGAARCGWHAPHAGEAQGLELGARLALGWAWR